MISQAYSDFLMSVRTTQGYTPNDDMPLGVQDQTRVFPSKIRKICPNFFKHHRTDTPENLGKTVKRFEEKYGQSYNLQVLEEAARSTTLFNEVQGQVQDERAALMITLEKLVMQEQLENVYEQQLFRGNGTHDSHVLLAAQEQGVESTTGNYRDRQAYTAQDRQAGSLQQLEASDVHSSPAVEYAGKTRTVESTVETKKYDRAQHATGTHQTKEASSQKKYENIDGFVEQKRDMEGRNKEYTHKYEERHHPSKSRMDNEPFSYGNSYNTYNQRSRERVLYHSKDDGSFKKNISNKKIESLAEKNPAHTDSKPAVNLLPKKIQKRAPKQKKSILQAARQTKDFLLQKKRGIRMKTREMKRAKSSVKSMKDKRRIKT